MGLLVARIVVGIIAGYASVGVAVASLALVGGLHRIDAAAKQGTLGFHLIVFPGIIALWPVVCVRWWRVRGELGRNDDMNWPPALAAHLAWWSCLSGLLVAAFVIAIVNR